MRTMFKVLIKDSLNNNSSSEATTSFRSAPPLRYNFQLAYIDSPQVAATFIQFCQDDETSKWLDDHTTPKYFRQAVASWMCWCFSLTTKNAILHTGDMFVLSASQLQRIMEMVKPSRTASVLDIGAGDGGVTKQFAAYYQRVFSTEASLAMRVRLWNQGYTVLDDARLQQQPEYVSRFDAVVCFNVLDRCDKPLSLLHSIKKWMAPDGLLFLALVLPWCPFVERGAAQVAPSEPLPMEGARCMDNPRFEKCASVFVERVMVPLGFEVVALSRVPYLCEGSSTHKYYALDDLLLVARVHVIK